MALAPWLRTSHHFARFDPPLTPSSPPPPMLSHSAGKESTAKTNERNGKER